MDRALRRPGMEKLLTEPKQYFSPTIIQLSPFIYNCVAVAGNESNLLYAQTTVMKRILLPLLLMGSWSYLPAQSTDNASLIKEAADKLKNKTATVSSVLTDKRYLPVHPETDFRELIKNNCSTGVLQITTADEPGRKIKVLGTVSDKEGQPVAGALIYLYQTDAKGWYAAGNPHVGGNEGDMRHARLFGYVRTDVNGKFELHTIKPSGYPRSDLPAHIHVHVWADGYLDFVNEFLFDDDERLRGTIREQSIRNRFLIQKPEKATAPFDQQFSYQIQLSR